MKASKFFVSSAAVVTVVGAIGVSYAQSGDNNVPKDSSGTTNAQSQRNTTGSSTSNNAGMQNAPADRSTDNTNRDATVNTNSTDTMSNERMARADRN